MSFKVRDEPLESMCTLGQTEAQAHTLTVNIIISILETRTVG